MALVTELAEWGRMKQTGVSLKQMMKFPSEISAQFLHKELSIRIAHRVHDLQNLPYGLSSKKAVLQVRDWYVDSFRDLRSYPEIKDKKDELKFTELVKMIKMRHNNVVPMMTLGVKQLMKERPQFDYKDLKQIHQFLDPFYSSRIGIRMLIGHHVASHYPNQLLNCKFVGHQLASHLPNSVGYINTKMSPREVAYAASKDAWGMCFREYGKAPEICIFCLEPDLTFPYVPSHLYRMVFELVKKYAFSLQEQFMDCDIDAPPIRIVIESSDHLKHLDIEIFDEGFGIPISPLDKGDDFDAGAMPHYGYDYPISRLYGHEIPISRLYARYFGGYLQILPMKHHSTRAILHLSSLGDSQDYIPVSCQI